jgi:hypothetical protein
MGAFRISRGLKVLGFQECLGFSKCLGDEGGKKISKCGLHTSARVVYWGGLQNRYSRVQILPRMQTTLNMYVD